MIDETNAEGNKTESEDGFNKLVKELTSKTIEFAKVCFETITIPYPNQASLDTDDPSVHMDDVDEVRP